MDTIKQSSLVQNESNITENNGGGQIEVKKETNPKTGGQVVRGLTERVVTNLGT